MSEYGDTAIQTSNAIENVSQDSPLQQDETNINYLFSVQEYRNGAIEKANIKGYLEINFR